jgi:signal transduction histidine kinase
MRPIRSLNIFFVAIAVLMTTILSELPNEINPLLFSPPPTSNYLAIQSNVFCILCNEQVRGQIISMLKRTNWPEAPPSESKTPVPWHSLHLNQLPGEEVVPIARPITKQKLWLEIKQSLRESESRAAAGQYSAAIMHEINNPLESISNLAYLVHQEADNAAKVREYISLLESELANLIRIARQTLSFHRPSTARLPTDIVTVAESALRVHERRIADKQIHLVTDLAPDSVVKVHPGEILQVLSNLVGNAVDALPDNGTLCLRVRKSINEVHVTIADDGHGIPKVMLKKVFDPFFTTKKEHGTGLGLAISKTIVEGHLGRITIRSSTRRGHSGTAFRVSLPIQPETPPNKA